MSFIIHAADDNDTFDEAQKRRDVQRIYEHRRGADMDVQNKMSSMMTLLPPSAGDPAAGIYKTHSCAHC